MNRRGIVELAFLLPWVGAFLLLPPVLIILHTWSRESGFPLLIVYLYVVWLALIVAGRVVSKRLARLDDADPRSAPGTLVGESEGR